ncbi:hypothetical protein [Flavobacterium sp. KACC 22763]|uniref:hypothetical protein n=1 Tax=Flavobacterium sp. KACC 22763 TaxID=3025668 RepID=UPI0023654FAE|nr:hypothetical protein [Flavobacterium sp. KACC 22763]WDF64477.1 hypothetical protein PQ463_23050 [Flavobacterium sp. KACC 22763]
MENRQKEGGGAENSLKTESFSPQKMPKSHAKEEKSYAWLKISKMQTCRYQCIKK